MSKLAIENQKNNTNNKINLQDPNPNLNTQASNNPNSSKNFSLIPIAAVIGISLILALVLSLVICLSNKNNKHYTLRAFNSTSIEKDNSIKAYYIIHKGDEDTLLFHQSYLDSIESIKINGNDVNITNTKTFENSGNNQVEIKFKDKLTSLESLFLNCHNLNEIDLYNLTTENVDSTAEMFRGCNNLEKINFGDFETKNIKNISNMFFGCEKLTSIDVSFFENDKLVDIQGLFLNCGKLTKINFGNFNTNN